MDRITDDRTPQVSREVRPVDRLSPSRPLSSEGGDKPPKAPYGVVDRVTLSPEGRAMAMQQRATQPAGSSAKPLTYGPGKLQAPPMPRLPYTPDS